MARDTIFDFIGIGLGRNTAGLAGLAAPLPDTRSLFLDKRPAATSPVDVLTASASVDSEFMADLVCLSAPVSRYGYLYYCRLQGRPHLYSPGENFHLARQEYQRYREWVVDTQRNARFESEVMDVRHDSRRACYVVAGIHHDTGQGFEYRTRRLVLGLGRGARLPACCPQQDSSLHADHYVEQKPFLQRQRSITVVGSGHSGMHVYLDLLRDAAAHGYALTWVTRSPWFPRRNGTGLGPDAGPMDAIYEQVGAAAQAGGIRTRLLSRLDLRVCTRDGPQSGYRLRFGHTELGHSYNHCTDGLVLATGHAYKVPDYLCNVHDRIRWDATGNFVVNRHSAVDKPGCEIFVQRADWPDAPVAAGQPGQPDFDQACSEQLRLLRQLTGFDHYHGTRLGYGHFHSPVEAWAAAQFPASRRNGASVAARRSTTLGA
jgi:lysine N6-hydroxylase